jgi:hypothetical protein
MQITMHRPADRTRIAAVALEATAASAEGLSGKAVRLVANRLFPQRELTAQVGSVARARVARVCVLGWGLGALARRRTDKQENDRRGLLEQICSRTRAWACAQVCGLSEKDTPGPVLHYDRM